MIKVSLGGRMLTPDIVSIGVDGDNLAEKILFELPRQIAEQDTRLYTLSISIKGNGLQYVALLIINSDYTAIFNISNAITKFGTYEYSLRFASGDIVYGTEKGKMRVSQHLNVSSSTAENTPPNAYETILGQLGTLAGRVIALEGSGGAQGPPGPQGEKGEKGDKGDPGDLGIPVSNLSLQNPYADAGSTSAKSALHWHSTASDGTQPYGTVQTDYWGAGYSVAIKTDHNNSEGGTAQPGGLFIRGLEQSTTEGMHVGVFPLNSDTQSWRNQVQAGGSQHGDLVAVSAYYKGFGCALIANHPAEAGYEYTVEQIMVGGFDAVELYNAKYSRNFEGFWDETLTAGYRIWGVMTDDCHDVTKPDKFNVAWTNVLADSVTSADVVAAIKAGHMIACKGHDLEIISVGANSVKVKSGEASKFQLIGDGGAVLKEISGTSASFDDIDLSDLTYVRIKSISSADATKYACSQPFFTAEV